MSTMSKRVPSKSYPRAVANRRLLHPGDFWASGDLTEAETDSEFVQPVLRGLHESGV